MLLKERGNQWLRYLAWVLLAVFVVVFHSISDLWLNSGCCTSPPFPLIWWRPRRKTNYLPPQTLPLGDNLHLDTENNDSFHSPPQHFSSSSSNNTYSFSRFWFWNHPISSKPHLGGDDDVSFFSGVSSPRVVAVAPLMSAAKSARMQNWNTTLPLLFLRCRGVILNYTSWSGTTLYLLHCYSGHGPTFAPDWQGEL